MNSFDQLSTLIEAMESMPEQDESWKDLAMVFAWAYLRIAREYNVHLGTLAAELDDIRRKWEGS